MLGLGLAETELNPQTLVAAAEYLDAQTKHSGRQHLWCDPVKRNLAQKFLRFLGNSQVPRDVVDTFTTLACKSTAQCSNCVKHYRETIKTVQDELRARPDLQSTASEWKKHVEQLDKNQLEKFEQTRIIGVLDVLYNEMQHKGYSPSLQQRITAAIQDVLESTHSLIIDHVATRFEQFFTIVPQSYLKFKKPVIGVYYLTFHQNPIISDWARSQIVNQEHLPSTEALSALFQYVFKHLSNSHDDTSTLLVDNNEILDTLAAILVDKAPMDIDKRATLLESFLQEVERHFGLFTDNARATIMNIIPRAFCALVQIQANDQDSAVGPKIAATRQVTLVVDKIFNFTENKARMGCVSRRQALQVITSICLYDIQLVVLHYRLLRSKGFRYMSDEEVQAFFDSLSTPLHKSSWEILVGEYKDSMMNEYVLVFKEWRQTCFFSPEQIKHMSESSIASHCNKFSEKITALHNFIINMFEHIETSLTQPPPINDSDSAVSLSCSSTINSSSNRIGDASPWRSECVSVVICALFCPDPIVRDTALRIMQNFALDTTKPALVIWSFLFGSGFNRSILSHLTFISKEFEIRCRTGGYTLDVVRCVIDFLPRLLGRCLSRPSARGSKVVSSSLDIEKDSLLAIVWSFLASSLHSISQWIRDTNSAGDVSFIVNHVVKFVKGIANVRPTTTTTIEVSYREVLDRFSQLMRTQESDLMETLVKGVVAMLAGWKYFGGDANHSRELDFIQSILDGEIRSCITYDQKQSLRELMGKAREGKDIGLNHTTKAVKNQELPSQCSICLEGFNRKQKIGVLESCGHIFHLNCIKRWAKRNNTCPHDRQEFNTIAARDKIDGDKVEDIDVPTPLSIIKAQQDSIICRVCGDGDREESLMLCDRCDDGYHYDCIGLLKVPEQAWQCHNCRRQLKLDEPPPADSRAPKRPPRPRESALRLEKKRRIDSLD